MSCLKGKKVNNYSFKSFDDSRFSTRFEIFKNDNSISINIGKSPTGNCQVTSLSNIDKLVSLILKNKDDLSVVKDIVFECYKRLGYSANLILVETNNQTILEKIAKIRSKIQYESNTSILLLQLR